MTYIGSVYMKEFFIKFNNVIAYIMMTNANLGFKTDLSYD